MPVYVPKCTSGALRVFFTVWTRLHVWMVSIDSLRVKFSQRQLLRIIVRILLEQRESSKSNSPSFKGMISQSNYLSRASVGLSIRQQCLTLLEFGKEWYNPAKRRCLIFWKSKARRKTGCEQYCVL